MKFFSWIGPIIIGGFFLSGVVTALKEKKTPRRKYIEKYLKERKI